MKMETPKMDVVRFQEADVLASSPLALTGFNDTIEANAQIGGHSVSEFVATLKDTQMESTVSFKYGDKPSVLAVDLSANEENGVLENGTYHYFSDTHTWIWQHQ